MINFDKYSNIIQLFIQSFIINKLKIINFNENINTQASEILNFYLTLTFSHPYIT